MRAALALLLVLSMALLSGCGAKTTTASETAKPAEAGSTSSTAKVDNPVTITPDPGPLALKDPIADATIDPSDGVDEAEAQIAGGYYLRALRQERLADKYGDTAEEFSMLNQVTLQKEWLLTYSRTSVDGNTSSDAYAATIVVSTETGEQLRTTEAP